MKRATTLIGLLTLAWAIPGSALATGVTATSNSVTSAYTAVSSCGALSGIAISWTVTADIVTSVTLTSIPPACTGGTLSLTFAGSAGAAQGSVAATTVTGSSQTFSSITGSPAASSVTGAYVSVVGP